MEPTPGIAAAEYARRRAAILIEEARFNRRSNALIASKFTAIALTVVAAVALVKYAPGSLLYLVLPVALILLLFVLHEKVLQSLGRSARLKNFYDAGISRLEDRWAGTGETGGRFLDLAHPYARDLDLFGNGSLYELLCTARTRAGQQTLAAWLLAPASVQEILARQEAVKELAPLIDFREQLALAGEDIRTGAQPETLIEWSESTVRLSRRFARIVAPILTALWILSLVAWAITGFGAPALLMTLINLMVTYRTRTQVDKSAAAIEHAMHELDLLAGIFHRIEIQPFTSKKLVDLQADLHSHHRAASDAITKLHQHIDWLESNDNPLVKFADLLIFWTAQWSAAIEAWRSQHGAAVRTWLAVVGEIEALNAFAAYTYEHPSDTFPQFTEAGTSLDAVDFAHPLLPASRAVVNSLKLDRTLQLLVISGPNMAGKSTFIRSVGVNVVLAQAGAPVRARIMVLSPLTVAASICVLDSLQGGLSRFYAEILRLKLIDEQSRHTTPVLFLLDELLSGTNSHDRRIGTESFVRTLLARGAIGLVTTHDLALAEIAEKLPGQAANFHFEDHFENGELHFNYRLTPGIVSTTNALKLMRSVGLEV